MNAFEARTSKSVCQKFMINCLFPRMTSLFDIKVHHMHVAICDHHATVAPNASSVGMDGWMNGWMDGWSAEACTFPYTCKVLPDIRATSADTELS